MRTLDAELRRLEAEYAMFFGGGQGSRLPWELRVRVGALIRRHDRARIRNTAERFRVEALQARFASFCALWDRTLRAREEGRLPAADPGGRRER